MKVHLLGLRATFLTHSGQCFDDELSLQVEPLRLSLWLVQSLYSSLILVDLIPDQGLKYSGIV